MTLPKWRRQRRRSGPRRSGCARAVRIPSCFEVSAQTTESFLPRPADTTSTHRSTVPGATGRCDCERRATTRVVLHSRVIFFQTLTRAVLGLEDVVSLDVPYPSRTEDDHPYGKNRWQFAPQGLTVKNGRYIVFSECTPETAFGGVSTVHGVYTLHGVEQNVRGCAGPVLSAALHPCLIPLLSRALCSSTSGPGRSQLLAAPGRTQRRAPRSSTTSPRISCACLRRR